MENYMTELNADELLTVNGGKKDFIDKVDDWNRKYNPFYCTKIAGEMFYELVHWRS